MKRLLHILILGIAIFSSCSGTQEQSVQPVENAENDTVVVGTVTDHEGNVYRTVQIGEQTWMAENMRCTTSPTGKRWGSQPGNGKNYMPYFAHKTDTDDGWDCDEIYYNWAAAIDYMPASGTVPFDYQPDYPCRGICPQGWHIPSHDEWVALERFVGQNHACNGKTGNDAKALASTVGWDYYHATCAVGNTPSDNNATGFSALPAGVYFSSDGRFDEQGTHARFWSSTQHVEHVNF